MPPNKPKPATPEAQALLRAAERASLVKERSGTSPCYVTVAIGLRDGCPVLSDCCYRLEGSLSNLE